MAWDSCLVCCIHSPRVLISGLLGSIDRELYSPEHNVDEGKVLCHEGIPSRRDKSSGPTGTDGYSSLQRRPTRTLLNCGM
jgi:hypothetical protein